LRRCLKMRIWFHSTGSLSRPLDHDEFGELRLSKYVRFRPNRTLH
jgi:hypothetical protein